MSGYETRGRTSQKQRTRNALKAAATELIEAGGRPTVAEVAEAAGISKSTAYRYFPAQELMYAEVVLTAAVGADRAQVSAAADGSGGVAERLDRVVRADHVFTVRHQHALRTGLRAYLLLVDNHPDAPREASHRVSDLTTALEPVADKLPVGVLSRLIAALSLCVGVEAALITQVGCRLSAEDSEEVKRWAASALLAAALDEAAGSVSGRPAGNSLAPATAVRLPV